MFVFKKSYVVLEKEYQRKVKSYEELIHDKAKHLQKIESQLLDSEIKNRNLEMQIKALEISVDFLQKKIAQVRDIFGIEYPEKESE